jgi:hypothetical protein
MRETPRNAARVVGCIDPIRTEPYSITRRAFERAIEIRRLRSLLPQRARRSSRGKDAIRPTTAIQSLGAEGAGDDDGIRTDYWNEQGNWF